MNFTLANVSKADTLLLYDKHIQKENLLDSIRSNRVYIAEHNRTFCGLLRYQLFWDNTPFINMLYLLDHVRGQGCGRKFVEYWEGKVKLQGYDLVMTSTQSNEYAQHFFLKLGYRTVGGFMPENESYEVILSKKLV